MFMPQVIGLYVHDNCNAKTLLPVAQYLLN